MPTPPSLSDWTLLMRHLSGETNAEEEEALVRRLATEPGLRQEWDRLNAVWSAAGTVPKLAPKAFEDDLAAVMGRIQIEAHPKPKTAPDVSRVAVARSNVLRGATWRLLVGGVVIGAFAALIIGHERPSPRLSSLHRTYATKPGQQATVALADGSRAVLGPATTLTTAEDARAGIAVTVVGQALFAVAPHHQTPFTVRTDNAVTRVLGTTFMVRRYGTDLATRVVVTEGRVTVQSAPGLAPRIDTFAPEGVVLTAGMLGAIDDSGHVRVTKSIVPEDYTAWTTGQLVFRETPVHDIVTELSRAYGVDIRLADTRLGTRALTWTVPVSQRSLAGVLETLTELLSAHSVQSSGIITIVPGPAATRRPVDPRTISTSEHHYGM